MKTLVRDEYGFDHLLIGCVHTLALPGSPLYDRSGGMRKLVKHARKDARILEADTPVAVGTGVSQENIARLAEVADIFIVGTSIRKDRQTLNAVEPARAQAFVKAYQLRKAA